MFKWRNPFALISKAHASSLSGFAAGHHSVSREPHPALIQFGVSSFITCLHRFPQSAWGVVSSRHSWNTAQIFHTVVKLVHLSRYIHVMSALMDLYHKFVYYRGEKAQQLNSRSCVFLCCWLVALINQIMSLTSLTLFTWKMFLLLRGTMGRRAKICLKCLSEVVSDLWMQRWYSCSFSFVVLPNGNERVSFLWW